VVLGTLRAAGERLLEVKGATDIQEFETRGHVVVVVRERWRRRVLVEGTVTQ
jgi:hypothetical protein